MESVCYKEYMALKFCIFEWFLHLSAEIHHGSIQNIAVGKQPRCSSTIDPILVIGLHSFRRAVYYDHKTGHYNHRNESTRINTVAIIVLGGCWITEARMGLLYTSRSSAFTITSDKLNMRCVSIKWVQRLPTPEKLMQVQACWGVLAFGSGTWQSLLEYNRYWSWKLAS